MSDYTASTILEKFSNQGTAQSVERVLKKLATKKAAEILAVCCRIEFRAQLHINTIHFQTRPPRLPSYTFISAYFAAFRSRRSCHSRPLRYFLTCHYFRSSPHPPSGSLNR